MRRRRARASRGVSHPPAFVPTLRGKTRLRYLSDAGGGTYPVTRKCLLNLFEMATTAVTSARLFAAVKLHSVEVWAPPNPTGSVPTTVEVQWVGNTAPSTAHSDTSMTVSPAHVRTTPPDYSSDQWWCISGTSTESEILFYVTVPAVASVVDVVVSFRLYGLDDTASGGDAPAGAVAGTLYGNYLDGLSSGHLSPLNNVPVLP